MIGTPESFGSSSQLKSFKKVRNAVRNYYTTPDRSHLRTKIRPFADVNISTSLEQLQSLIPPIVEVRSRIPRCPKSIRHSTRKTLISPFEFTIEKFTWGRLDVVFQISPRSQFSFDVNDNWIIGESLTPNNILRGRSQLSGDEYNNWALTLDFGTWLSFCYICLSVLYPNMLDCSEAFNQFRRRNSIQPFPDEFLV